MATTQAPPLARQAPPLVRLGTKPRLGDYLRSLWARREFAMAVPAAELHAQHRNTVLGGLWHVLDPLISVGVWYVMFGVILDVNRGVDNLTGFLAIGIFVWHFTTRAVRQGARAITTNEGLLRSISFPRAIMPLSVVVAEFIALAYSFVAMFAIVLVTGEEPSWTWFLLFPIVLLQLVFNAGAALFMARVADRFRDVLQVLPYTLRIWGMVSGTFYPVVRRLADKPVLFAIMKFNPAFLYMEMSRRAILDNHAPSAQQWITIVVWAVVALVGGFLFFLGKEHEYGRG
jgi:teichoic acid transport system permease protein